MPLRTVALQGFLCGCALLLKYTVLGFYLGLGGRADGAVPAPGLARQLGQS